MKRSLGILMALGVLGGCSTTAVKMGEFSPVPLKFAAIMPSKAELSGAPPKVVIFPLNDRRLRMASQAHLGRTVADTLQSYLSESGVDILDRSMYGKLRNEIALAEMKGEARSYGGPSVAGFAIAGDISKADYTHSFTEQSYWKDQNGNMHFIPASCSFNTDVAGNINIYRVPSLQMVKSIGTDATESSSRQTRDSSCQFSNKERSSLLREAASAAVDKARTKLQNFFAPSGYVLERRENKDHKNIFKISIGTTHGSKQGAACDFYQTIASKNPVTGVTSNEEYVIATGEVSNQVGPDYAWVVVNDDQASNKIRLGDKVKFHYTAGFFETVKNLAH